MINKTQLNSLKNIYQLFNNICDHASVWISEIKESDEINMHIEKLTIIMNLITNITEKIEGDLDDIIIIVEENLKEYILDKYSKDKGEETAEESSSEELYYH
jgi:hypothetical protein